MKHTVYGISLAAVALLVVAIALGISGKNVRANEMETSLNAAIEQSMEQLRIGKGSGEGNSQDMVADFNQLLLLQMESESDVQVEVLTADAERGILDVRVRERYQNILGQGREAVCRKSVILEGYVEKNGYHTVTFLVDGQMYSQYSLYGGGKVVFPKAPEKSGKTFQHWAKQGQAGGIPEGMEIREDLTVEAVFQ